MPTTLDSVFQNIRDFETTCVAGRCDSGGGACTSRPLSSAEIKPLHCLSSRLFAEAKCAEAGLERMAKSNREAGRFSQSLGDSFCTALDISVTKPCSATTAHKGPSTDATQPADAAQTALQGPTRGHEILDRSSDYFSRLLAKTGGETKCLLFDFPQLFEKNGIVTETAL